MIEFIQSALGLIFGIFFKIVKTIIISITYLFLPFLLNVLDNEIYKIFFEKLFSNELLDNLLNWGLSPLMWLFGNYDFFEMIVSFILSIIAFILLLITLVIIIIIPLLNFIIFVSIFLLPIILFKNQSKQEHRKFDVKYLVPFYNMYKLCKKTNTNFNLFLALIVINLFNPPFKNLFTYAFGEEIFLNNDLFSLIALLIYVLFGIIFFTILIRNYLKIYNSNIVIKFDKNSTKNNEKQINTISELTQITDKKEIVQNSFENAKEENNSTSTTAIYKEQERPVITEKPKRKCPNCGAGNGLEAKYCFICNTEFKDNQK